MTTDPKLSHIAMMIFDVDGVLTDGGIYIDHQGNETKRFNVQDGFALRAAMSVGLKVAVLTGRSSPSVTHRMAELGITLVIQGCKDKAVGLAQLCQQAGPNICPDQCAYVGDDLIDLPAMLKCSYPIAVANAAQEVKAIAKYTTTQIGGHGGARQAIEHVLSAQAKWDTILKRYI